MRDEGGDDEEGGCSPVRSREGEIEFIAECGCETVCGVEAMRDVTRDGAGRIVAVFGVHFSKCGPAGGGCSKVTFLRSADSSGKTIRDAQPDWRFASNQHHTVPEPPSWS